MSIRTQVQNSRVVVLAYLVGVVVLVVPAEDVRYDGGIAGRSAVTRERSLVVARSGGRKPLECSNFRGEQGYSSFDVLRGVCSVDSAELRDNRAGHELHDALSPSGTADGCLGVPISALVPCLLGGDSEGVAGWDSVVPRILSKEPPEVLPGLFQVFEVRTSGLEVGNAFALNFDEEVVEGAEARATTGVRDPFGHAGEITA